MSHTEGKLISLRHAIINADDKVIASVGGPLTQEQSEEAARRLVDCWNAFVGLPTEQVESFDKFREISTSVADSTISELKRLEKERDEALEALRNIERVSGLAMMQDDPARVAARAIIAKHQKVAG